MWLLINFASRMQVLFLESKVNYKHKKYIMTYKLVSVVYVEPTVIELTVEKIPGFFGRLFGLKTKLAKFHGQHNVWYEYPTGKRQGVTMKMMISRLLREFEFKIHHTI